METKKVNSSAGHDLAFDSGYRDGVNEIVDLNRLNTDERYRAGYVQARDTVDALRRHIASAPRQY